MIAAVVAADQATKAAVVRALEPGESRPLAGGVVRLSHVRNPGAAFGLLRGFTGLLTLAALAGVVAFILILVRRPPPLVGWGAALVAGGAAGNLVDRLARPGGMVVDFIDLRFWPAFNVADAAITVGAGLLLVSGVRRDRGRAA